MAWMVTIDNGSTFTDGCLLADGTLHAVKVLTTPYDLMRCFVEVFRGLARAAGFPSEGELLRRVEEVRYSTTSGTNALLVRKGVRVGVIVGPDGTKDLYGLRGANAELVEALVGNRATGFALGEGQSAEIEIRILQAIRELLGRGAQWIVVSLPEPWGERTEQEFKRTHMKLLPGHLLGSVPVLYSRELCADPDDARRTATAILNGFLHREMARFLYHAEGWVRDRHVAQPLRIMRNDGATGRVAKTTAVKTLDSGPMGGLAGAAALARLAGEPRLVTVDVGGTSSDLGVIDGTRPGMDLFGSVHGLPLSFSFPQLRTAALGGGSLFRVEGEALRIGPESAGALPGPVCFGRGGSEPTLTDAALLAGYLDAKRFAAGAIDLQPALAEAAIAERIAKPLGLAGAHAGAAAMIEAFADRLAAEVRFVLGARGWAADQAALVVFGGSGPLLSCLVAERVGLRRLIVPPASSSFSALGVGFAELAHEYRTLLGTPTPGERWRSTIGDLRARAERDMFGESVPSAACRGAVRLREENGSREVPVADPLQPPDELRQRGGRFALDYRFALGASGASGFPRVARDGAAGPPTERRALVGGELATLRVLDAGGLAAGTASSGPCLLETPFWSALVPEGWSIAETGFGLRLTR
ncbi:MAG: hydantoinase/oxoprolinase family protein [Deltaproteobacteria bacterium]|nr:hydantoinase/oxoprolinase family protein [Deltaproteobacteria bacterium]